jgi:hypothetical protein
MRRVKALKAPVEYLERRAQDARQRIEESHQLLAQYQAPRSMVDLFAQSGSASDPNTNCPDE